MTDHTIDEAFSAQNSDDENWGLASAEGLVTAKPREGFRVSRNIVVLSNPSSMQAEAIGALRTHLLAQHIRDGRRSLAVCGPTEGVGTSYLSVNLAVSLALAGINTLLIDANMRAPAVDDYLQPSANHDGLAQYLIDPGVSVDGLIEADVLPNLSILYSGGMSINAQELLAGRAFSDLVESCMRTYDVTIVDTPPGNVSADSRRIATAVRYALLVARKNETFVSDVQTLAEELTADRAKVIGTWLNTF